MKKITILLNALLLAAVGILYYFHFTENKAAAVPPAVVPPGMYKGSGIVFVNSDSLLNQYEYFKSKKTEYQDKQNSVRESLKSEGTKLQNEVKEYQERAGTMTDAQRQQTEQQLAVKQQQYLQKKDDLLGKLDDEQSKTNEELYNRLSAFMKEFNKKRNYTFVLGYQKGGGILFANDSLDITHEVVEGLNKKYAEEKKSSK